MVIADPPRRSFRGSSASPTRPSHRTPPKGPATAPGGLEKAPREPALRRTRTTPRRGWRTSQPRSIRSRPYGNVGSRDRRSRRARRRSAPRRPQCLGGRRTGNGLCTRREPRRGLEPGIPGTGGRRGLANRRRRAFRASSSEAARAISARAIARYRADRHASSCLRLVQIVPAARMLATTINPSPVSVWTCGWETEA